MIWHSIDPGQKYYAWVCWREAILLSTGVSTLADLPCFPQGFAVLERPVNQGRHLRPQTLARLAVSAGLVAGRFREVEWFTYAEWAGSMPGALCRAKVRARLTPAQLALLPTSKKDLEHVLDAIGLGQYYLSLGGKYGAKIHANTSGR